MPSQLAFAIFSFVVLVAAWRVVTTANVVRAALALVIVLGGMAPLFLMLAAEFVAVVQILVYVGAVVVLFLFAIMVTRSPMSRETDPDYKYRWPGFVAAGVLFIVLWAAIRNAFGNEKIEHMSIGRTAAVGSSLLHDHVIAFEAISLLLLAVLVGTVALARRDRVDD